MTANKSSKVKNDSLTGTDKNNSKLDLRRLKSICKLLKQESHIQSIEIQGESIKVSAFPPVKEIVKSELPKPVGAIKAPPVDTSPMGQFESWKKQWVDAGLTNG